MKFAELPLAKSLLHAVGEAGYQEATPIQQKAIPPILSGRDVIGCAQTGTGKTAGFSLPLLQRLVESGKAQTGAAKRRRRSGRRVIRGLILAPTRELAAQIGESLATYGRKSGLRHTVIYGGVRQGSQVRAVQAGVDIVVATPGRLLDLIGQGIVELGHVEIVVLDEADQMLDMGFIHDLSKILRFVPAERQTLMFSATMPSSVRKLADQWLHRPSEIKAAPVASTPRRVAQSVYFVERNEKPAALNHLLEKIGGVRTLVFARTKRNADKIARDLVKKGIEAVAIHGDKSQGRRQAVMREFNSDAPPVLVATDLAARGLDFTHVSHVINYDLPETPETYVHRIGRTARAGASGKAVSFCGQDERATLRAIEKLTGQRVKVQRLPEALQKQNAETVGHQRQQQSATDSRGGKRTAKGSRSKVSAGRAKQPAAGKGKQRTKRPPSRRRAR